jgi:hypothetical protein
LFYILVVYDVVNVMAAYRPVVRVCGTSSLLGPNTLLNTLFSNTLSLRSSLNVSDQVSHPYRTTDNIIVLYILIFKFLDVFGYVIYYKLILYSCDIHVQGWLCVCSSITVYATSSLYVVRVIYLCIRYIMNKIR